MKNPTKEQLDKVVKNLEKALKMAKNNAPVNMMQGSIDKEKNFCGTPACHGAWYAIAVYKKVDGKTYTDGAAKMAEHLGFDGYGDLKEWAEENPKLWGNTCGESMFSDGCAFGQKYDDDFGLETIVEHWKGVRARILELKS